MLDIILEVGFWAAAVRIATVLWLGTVGELICERAGVLNLGIEGIMTAGALAGWVWVFLGGDLWGAVLFAFCIGAAVGVLHAVLTVVLGLSQHVSGIGLTLFSASVSYFAFRMVFPNVTTPPKITPFVNYEVPLLADIPVLGEAFFNQTPLTYLAYAMLAASAYVLYKTPLGLAVRMVGENPLAAEGQGINVLAVRAGSVIVGSGIMAVGGSFLTISWFDAFYFGMVNGRGWICIALVIFASWRPGKAFWGALLFAGIEAFQVRAQQVAEVAIPYQFYLMLPFVISIVALILLAKNAAYPKALLVPFRRGER